MTKRSSEQPNEALRARSERDPFGVAEDLVGADAERLLDETREVVSTFASLATPVAPPARLRERLLQSVRTAPIAQAGNEPVPGVTFMLRAEGDWVDVGLAGVRFKYLQVDEVRRYVRTLVRMSAGATYPSHRHAAREETVLIEGDLFIDGQNMRPGDYCVAEAGSVHGLLSTKGGALFMAFGCLDDEFLPRLSAR